MHAIVDQSPLHILEQLAAEVDALSAALHRSVLLIAETDANDPRLVRNRDAGGYGLDAAWADDWHHALHVALTGERTGYYEDFGAPELLGKALRQAWVYDGVWSPHRQKTRGRNPIGVPPERFVVAAQNHDQVGNRAAGERLAAMVDEGRLKAAAALLLTTPFTPLLFQGEEWAASTPFQYFTDHADPGLGKAVAEGRRREFAAFGWNPGQLLARRPDLQIAMLRGNVPTRVKKLDAGEFDAIVLAAAGLTRLGMADRITQMLSIEVSIPAVAQGVWVQVEGDRIAFERESAGVRVNLGPPGRTVVEIVERA